MPASRSIDPFHRRLNGVFFDGLFPVAGGFHRDPDGGGCAGCGGDGEIGADHFRAFSHPDQAEPPLFFRGLLFVDFVALAIVGDFHGYATVEVLDQDLDGARFGVFGHVDQRLLGDPIECGADQPPFPRPPARTNGSFRGLPQATPISPPSGPDQWLFQGPPAESKFLAARGCPGRWTWKTIARQACAG